MDVVLRPRWTIRWGMPLYAAFVSMGFFRFLLRMIQEPGAVGGVGFWVTEVVLYAWVAALVVWTGVWAARFEVRLDDEGLSIREFRTTRLVWNQMSLVASTRKFRWPYCWARQIMFGSPDGGRIRILPTSFRKRDVVQIATAIRSRVPADRINWPVDFPVDS